MTFIRCLRILLTLLNFKFRHDSDTMLDKQDSPQWYDIVHFEHNLWLCFGIPQNLSYLSSVFL